MLGDKRLIQTIRLRNLLSFGPEAKEIQLQGLNLLIGPNGCGKSNLLEAIGLLQACPRDLQAPIRAGGGVSEWLWKGERGAPTAEIEVTIPYPPGPSPLHHSLSFTAVGYRFELKGELIADERSAADALYRNSDGAASIAFGIPSLLGLRQRRSLQLGELLFNQSILSQIRGADVYPEITFLFNEYDRVRIFRGWDTAPGSVLRLPQKTDLPRDFLSESGGNLWMVLNGLDALSGMRAKLLDRLKEFYEPAADFSYSLYGGVVQLLLRERDLSDAIPASRLSDGMLRYLCLLAILCHPTPPPLICIEEPEIGLHPDILPTVAKLLVEASERTQLIVTTHSDALVDALTDNPETVIVCDKEEGSTTMRRLDRDALKEWLEQYSLGHLWRTGELGGNRW